MVDEIDLRSAERRLQAAQLDELLDDRLIFTGPDGALYGKQDDLRVHRTGTQVIDALHEEDLTVLVAGETGITWFLGALRGAVDGKPFEARMRYTRTWTHDPGHGWRIIAAHASVV